MADTDKNILITPNTSSSTADPQIAFVGANSTVSGQTITVSAYPENSGTLSFDGSAGQLFSITNKLSGTIFSVNDVSGIPSIEVVDDGTISLARFAGKVGIGTISPTNKLEVAGTLGNWGIDSTGAVLTFTRNGANYINAAGVSSELYLQINSTNKFYITSAGTVSTTSLTAPTFIGALSGNATSSTNADTVDSLHAGSFLRSDAGNGNLSLVGQDGIGVKFWGSDYHTIHMSSTANGSYGARIAGETTSDYNMYFRMAAGTNRGFVFESGVGTKLFSINPDGVRSTPNITAPNFIGNLSGNAATVTGLTIGSGSGLTVGGSGSTLAGPDVATYNGINYTVGMSVLGQTDGALYSQAYSSSWVGQIFQDYRTGQLAVRGKNNGTWQAWRVSLDSGNYTSYSPTLTGSGASGTWGINISGTAATATTATTASNADMVDSLHAGSFLRSDAGNGNLRLTPGDGYGVRFWDGSGDSYSIHMSAASNGTYGGRIAGDTTSDYNMYFRMAQNINRGFVFENAYGTKLFSINGDGTRSVANITAPTFIGALSGNATSATSATTAGTVTAAAQPNITSHGTLTILNVDNIQVDLNTISSTNTNGNINLTPNGTGIIINSADIVPSVTATKNLGSASVVWNTFYGKATSAQYADLAENFVADQIYEPGTVLMIGGEQEVTLATQHSMSVIGTVSENPAYLMNSALKGDTVLPIAYTGRVPCKVVGLINKGDVLVVSEIPGVARSAATFSGDIAFAKALENYNSNEVGIIEIVIGVAVCHF